MILAIGEFSIARFATALVCTLLCLAAPLMAEHIRLVGNAGGLNNQALGVALREVYRRAGVDMTSTYLPAKRAAYMLDDGEFDGAVGRVTSFGDSRPDLLRLDPPINTLVTTAFFVQGRGHQIANRDDLTGKSVAVVRGIAHARRATAGVANVMEVANTEQLFLMLNTDRVDVVVHGAVGARAEVETLREGGVNLDSAPLGSVNSHHFLRNTFRKEAARIGTALREMTDTGEFATIFLAERARLIEMATSKDRPMEVTR